MKNELNILWLAPLIMLGIGILPMPIGYYTLLRLVVCCSAIYYAYNFKQNGDIVSMLIFIFIAILYNPIFPVYLYEKWLWIVVNIITAILFFIKRAILQKRVL